MIDGFIKQYWRQILATMLLIALLFVTIRWWSLHSVKFVDTQKMDPFDDVLDLAIERNAVDFQHWYKANIIIQVMSIVSSISATILASMSENEGRRRFKNALIFATAITSLTVALQSVFHIRDNINSFIQIANDLEIMQENFHADLAESKQSGSVSIDKVRHDYAIKYEEIQNRRWRAYAIIGQQPS